MNQHSLKKGSFWGQNRAGKRGLDQIIEKQGFFRKTSFTKISIFVKGASKNRGGKNWVD